MIYKKIASKKTLYYLSVIAIVTSIGYYYLFFVIPNGELGQKEKWATLQSAEIKYRNYYDAHSPVLLEKYLGTKYDLLGIPTNDDRYPRAWLILNKKFGVNKVNVLIGNEQQMFIGCSFVQGLENKTEIDASVLTFLNGICLK